MDWMELTFIFECKLYSIADFLLRLIWQLQPAHVINIYFYGRGAVIASGKRNNGIGHKYNAVWTSLILYLSLCPPDVQVPGVVLVMGDVDPVVVCDHPLVQAQDRLVTRLIGNIFGKQKIFLKVSPSPWPIRLWSPWAWWRCRRGRPPCHGDQSEESMGSRDPVSTNHSSPAHRHRHVVHAAQEHRLSVLAQAPCNRDNAIRGFVRDLQYWQWCTLY